VNQSVGKEEDAAAAILTSTGTMADKISTFTPPHPIVEKKNKEK